MIDPDTIMEDPTPKTPREFAGAHSNEHADIILETPVHEILAMAYGSLQAAAWASAKWPNGVPQDVLDYIEETIWWSEQSLGEHA